jgi:hypothetical protein
MRNPRTEHLNYNLLEVCFIQQDAVAFECDKLYM